MSEEVNEQKKCCNCYYVSDGYKRFLLGMLSSFIGCLVALSLYHGGLYPPSPTTPCYCPRYEAFEFEEFPEIEVEQPKPQKQIEHKKFQEHKPPIKHGK